MSEEKMQIDTSGPVEVTFPTDAGALRAAALQWLMSMEAARILVSLQRGDISVTTARLELFQGCKEARP